MNFNLAWAQEHIDTAKRLLAEWGDDDLAEYQIDAIRSYIGWANYYINEFYEEQQK